VRHEYRKGAHTIYQLHVHFVFVCKYRKPVLRGEGGLRVRELVREICTKLDVEILKGHVRPDHVHLLLSLPPNVAASRVMQFVKGKTSNKLMREFRHIEKAFWGRHVWARGYFAASSGNVTDEVISKYIEEQDVERPDEDFKVTE
jgi:putative transposase